MGGIRWAVCIETVKRYRANEVSSVMFIDQAFGLKHNGAIAYNKFYNTEMLQEILNWARDGETAKMEHYATETIKLLHAAYRGKVVAS